jgi:hypothetical protein
MKTKGIFTKPLSLPDFIFIFSVLAVLISIVIFYLVDLRNAFGLRDGLFSTSGAFFFYTYEPFFFHQWGRSGGLAEIIQWAFLGTAAIVAAYSAARVSFINKNLKVFWTILSAVLIFMLLEDAGGVRHTIMGYVQWVFNEPDQGIMGTSVEFLYFAILGGAPLYALIRYWKDIKAYVRSVVYLLIGFVFYGASQALSFVGTAFEGLMDKNIYDLNG